MSSAYFSLGGRKLFTLFRLETCEGLLQVLVQSVAGVPDNRQMLGEVLTMPSLDEDVIPSFMSAESQQTFRYLILDQQVGLVDNPLIGFCRSRVGDCFYPPPKSTKLFLAWRCRARIEETYAPWTQLIQKAAVSDPGGFERGVDRSVQFLQLRVEPGEPACLRCNRLVCTNDKPAPSSATNMAAIEAIRASDMLLPYWLFLDHLTLGAPPERVIHVMANRDSSA